MRIIVQRVFQGFVRVAGQQISRIQRGLLILVGVTPGDTPEIAEHMALKSLNMRLWDKKQKAWSGSVLDINGQILAVSQFTLYGIMKGNKPDFHGAMGAQQAKQLYDFYVDCLRKNYQADRIKTGKFQTLMQVGSVNNGPVTIFYEKNYNADPKDQKQLDREKKELAKVNKETARQIAKEYSQKEKQQKKTIEGKPKQKVEVTKQEAYKQQTYKQQTIQKAQIYKKQQKEARQDVEVEATAQEKTTQEK